MEWIADNWFFILLLLAFVALHVFGHGHHGRHGGHRGHGGRDRGKDEARHAGHQEYGAHAHDTSTQ